jgi:hypothetical protein
MLTFAEWCRTGTKAICTQASHFEVERVTGSNSPG